MATKSLHTQDGSYIKETRKAATVGQLIERLQELPSDLPLNQTCYLTWVNVGHCTPGQEESLMIIDSDVFGDDEEDE